MSTIDIIAQGALVALIAAVMRSLYRVKGPSVPKARGDANVYSIKWQWRAVGIIGTAFIVALSVWNGMHNRSRPDTILIVMTSLFIVIAIWLSMGSALTDRSGITKKGLWGSRTLAWSDITEIRLHKKQGGAIELRAGSRKLIVDFRVIAFEHLLHEIEQRTHLQSVNVS